MNATATLPLPATMPARPAVGDAPADERRAWLQLSGLHCAGCAVRIEEALRAVDGASSARVAAASGQAEVCWDPRRTRRTALIDAARRAGYRAAPATPAAARALRRAEGRDALWRLFVAGFCAMQVMMLAWPSYVAGPGEVAYLALAFWWLDAGHGRRWLEALNALLERAFRSADVETGC